MVPAAVTVIPRLGVPHIAYCMELLAKKARNLSRYPQQVLYVHAAGTALWFSDCGTRSIFIANCAGSTACV